MTLDRIDESANTNEGENWHCPDCQSWGPFTVDLITRVLLSEEGTHVFEDGDTDFDQRAFAMCEVCQRQAPVSSFRFEGALMGDPERHVRARWTRQGVDHATQDQIVATSPQRRTQAPGSARFRFQTRVRPWEQKGSQHDDPSGDDLCDSGR